MARHHVRRLPVLDKHGHLQGVLSIDDVVQASDRRGAPTAQDIVDALKGIYLPRGVEAVPR
jgi:CBS domain-containing protein